MLRIYTSNEIFVFEFPLNFVNHFIVLVYPRNFSDYERSFFLATNPHFRWLIMDQFKNLHLVDENCQHLPNKCIYIGMKCRYLLKGFIGLRHVGTDLLVDVV